LLKLRAADLPIVHDSDPGRHALPDLRWGTNSGSHCRPHPWFRRHERIVNYRDYCRQRNCLPGKRAVQY
jgi:hypothetical protein